MKKIVFYVLITITFLGALSGYSYASGAQDNNDLIDSISNKIIRFHVLANSNSKEDQELKIKVKDKIIEYIFPALKESNSLEESREILAKNEEEIIKIANECIRENGYDYSVSIEFKRENFPEKVYGNITLPQGEYEAFRVLIGQASGENWWCVMFPPICFVDVTKGQVSYDETEEVMKEALTDDEFNEVNNNMVVDESENIKFSLKIFDLFE
ncbi:MAG: stage II sporulation protein R [Clostridium perfringens]|nr:stage II sporulation protein R [Clostridium perfringens]